MSFTFLYNESLMMSHNYTITPQQSRLRCYKRALREELRHTTTNAELRVCPINHPRILEYKARILGGRSQVREFADWTWFLLKDYGPQKRCLSLGSGIGRVEKYLIKIGFTANFETIEINPRHNVMSRNMDSRIDAREGDLNFVELKSNTYDFVLCHGILHHLINHEHVLYQINQSLKPNGLLLIYEYVGESRCQFTEERLTYLRGMFPDFKLRNVPVWKVDGFEAIRSFDLLGLIEAQFGPSCERMVNYGSVFVPLVICNWPAAQRQMERIVELDAEISQRGELSPCYHMGVYRKSDAMPPKVVPWTDEELKARLCPPITGISQRLARLGNSVKNTVRLRTRLRSLQSHLWPPETQVDSRNGRISHS